MAAVGRRALTLTNPDFVGTVTRYAEVLQYLQHDEIPDDVLLLFADRVRPHTCGCWHWGAVEGPLVYGNFSPGKEWTGSSGSKAHRFAWSAFNGHDLEQQPSLVVDHLCPDRACVAPWHLTLETFAENVRLGKTRSHADQTCSEDYCPTPQPPNWVARDPLAGWVTAALLFWEELRELQVKEPDDARKLFQFAAHVAVGEVPDGELGLSDVCWDWQGALTDGYGKTTWKQVKGETRSAHRWSYEHFAGPVIDGLHVDHICERRSCVRPSHLQLLTSKQNSAKAARVASTLNASKTHCLRGHAFDEDNTLVAYRPNRVDFTRQCRKCRELRAQGLLEAGLTGGKVHKDGYCAQGHEMSEGNTRLSSNGLKSCRKCAALARQRYSDKKKSEGRASRHPRKPAEEGREDVASTP